MAYSRSSQRKVRNLSLIHFAIAALCLIVGVSELAAVSHWSSLIGFGIWGGIWIFLIGLLGYFSIQGEDENSRGKGCLIGTHMAIAIIGAIVSAVSVVGLSFALIDLSDCVRCFSDRHHNNNNHGPWQDDSIYPGNSTWYHQDYSTSYRSYCGGYGSLNPTESECKTGCGLVSCLLVLQLLEVVLAIASAAFCCSAVCCGQPFRPNQNPQIIYVPSSGAEGFVQMGGPAIGAQPGQIIQQPLQYYQPQQQYTVQNQSYPPQSQDGTGAIGTTAPGQQATPIAQKN